MKLSKQELATVLAALRYWQNDLEDDEDMFQEVSGSCHFENHSPLTVEQVDALCERINCDDTDHHQLTKADLRAIQTIREEHRFGDDNAALSYALQKVAKETRKAQRDRIIRI